MVRSTWRHTLAILFGVCALALVASVHQSLGQRPASASSVGVTPAASATTSPPECRAADLRADYRARDAAAGHRYGVIRLRNAGDRACVVQGYGGLSYVGGGDGTEVGAPADREPATARPVVLAPGKRALSRVSETVAENYPRKDCRPVEVDGFRVYAPDATKAFFVLHPTTGCLDDSVHLLSHRPFHG